ncbi:hypothetical protein N864_20505 [Intrasporangium chromatireducens Q5-1]|uniref:Pyridoxamine 5'-phosphate oxidase N-terminal domain-containing protein n=1 Tax=Intrasporangium chromatireducens Q5-1 TaxID=584657 RepID=W9GB00_9MICO|nr:pyridoxamine 5'-phosphate oxidase family protein [Intrasporangium chromatireducens]EWT02412.1 hypothetical protein N864_20505 [Intrasporangium chromatireducens Q5-1]
MELDAVQDRTLARASRATLAAYPTEFRLTGRRLVEYLDQRTFAVVSTTRRDGRAHAVVASYVREGATFWLPTEGGTVRLRNVRAHAWAALTVTEGDRGNHVVVPHRGACRGRGARGGSQRGRRTGEGAVGGAVDPCSG